MVHTLLLADDSVTIQRVIELTFADEDVRVIAVGDGQKAIEQIDAEPPDIVLADVGMPTRNGYEVATFVKTTPRLSHIPVILLTGAFEPVDEARVQAIGCDGILVKPFEPYMVITRVKELLAKRPTPSSIVARPRTESGSLAPAIGQEPDSQAALEQYFARLDAAFARLDTVGQPASLSGDEAVSRPAAVQSVDRPPPATLADPAVPAPPASVAEAFATILAAEQGDGPPLESWQLRPGPPLVGQELIEEIVSRVLQRLSAAVVRERLAEMVSETAERLVREEIERIKASAR